MSQAEPEHSLVDEITQVLKRDDHDWWDSPYLSWFMERYPDNRLVQELTKNAEAIREGDIGPMALTSAIMIAQGFADHAAEDDAVVYRVKCHFGKNGAGGWLATVEPTPESSTGAVTGDNLERVVALAVALIDVSDPVVLVDVELPTPTRGRLLFIRQLHEHVTRVSKQITAEGEELWTELRELGMSDGDIKLALTYINNQC